MNRSILVCILLVATAAALGAQEASQTAQSSPYEGVSRPPADDQIITTDTPEAKPEAGHRVAAPVALQSQPTQPSAIDSSNNLNNSQAAGNDGGEVQGVRLVSNEQASNERGSNEKAWADDPDGDIVHARPRREGEIGEGTTIRVRLLDRLSTASSEKGEPFHSRVASDVLQGGRLVIPAGAEIDGQVVRVSTGRPGGHGSMRLEPEMVILPNGSRFQLHAEVTGAPGSRARVGSEGSIGPGSRAKRDGIEYGAAVGTGLVAGAIVAGPVGALTGSLIGAGAITVHLLVNHPQATLESGTVLMFTLTEPLDMVAGTSSGN
jgi:hypothetical protein